MPDTPSDNPLVRSLQVLMQGVGYNFYNTVNQAPADDLLVRQQASSALGQASAALQTLEAAYRQQYIPASTRDNPYPPPEAMEKLRALGRLRQRIQGVEADIRGMAVPTQDKIWWRFRQEATLLHTLLTFDLGLVQQSAQIAQVAQALTPDDWQAATADPLASALSALAKLLRDRQQLLI